MRRHAPLIALVLGLLLFSAIYWGGMLLENPTVVLEDQYDGHVTDLSMNIGEPAGWTPGAPLLLNPGQRGHLVYDITQPPDATVIAVVECADAPGLEATMRLLWSVEGVQGEAVEPLQPGRNEIDLTPHLPETGLLRVALEAHLPLGVPPQPAFTSFQVTQTLPRTLHWPALLFFFITGALLWVGIPAIITAEWRWPDAPNLRPLAVIAILAAVGALHLLPHRTLDDGTREPFLTGRKFFDDSRAISNAALMLANGGDTDQLYFRSILRPGFLAHTIPLTILFPQRFIRASHQPSDFHVRLWREFDRANDTFGSFRQLEISAMAWFEAIACALVCALIWRRLGCGPLAAWLAALLTSIAFVRIIANPVTIIWNLLMSASAVLAALRLFAKPTLGRSLFAGAMLGLMALTKITALMTYIPLAALWIGHGITLRGSDARRFWGWTTLALGVSTALVLWWFEGFREGLVAELVARRAVMPRVMELHPEFPRRSWDLVFELLWTLAGPGWLLVAMGLSLGAHRFLPNLNVARPATAWTISPQAWTFALIWALSGALAFLMPFLFPRFLKYMTPGLGLIAAAGVVAVIQMTRGGTRQSS